MCGFLYTRLPPLLQLFNETELSEEKVRILRVFGHAGSEDKLKRLLDFTVSVRNSPSSINAVTS